MTNVREAVELYLQEYPPALKLFRQLANIGEVYLIGGILREYQDNDKIIELRDADFIVDVKYHELWKSLIEEYQPKGNHFDGYKFYCENGFLMDIWEVDKTWAYRNGIVKFHPNNYLESLPRTVFLNMDAIIYDLNEDKWYDSIYQEAIKTGVLDVVLKENPHVELNILRALVLRRKYQMRYSDKLRELILEYIKADDFFVDSLIDIQYNRYQKEVLSRTDIEAELRQIMCET